MPSVFGTKRRGEVGQRGGTHRASSKKTEDGHFGAGAESKENERVQLIEITPESDKRLSETWSALKSRLGNEPRQPK